MLLNIRKIITICNDKVCEVLHQIEFAAHHPCQASLGWDGSKVALPVLDSALRRFDYPFLLHD